MFHLVHSDVWGPAPIVGGNGFKYFVTFIDDCTRMTWVYFLKHKSEVFDKFILFLNLVKTQFQTTIKILRSDNGGEFVNHVMSDFFVLSGLIHQTSCAYTPEQNGVAERKNRIILEITRSVMIESRIPTFLWPEAVATSVFLLNRLPTKILNMKTPLDVLSNQTNIPAPLNLSPKVFGCSVYVHIHKHERTKLSPCAKKCVFVGYGINQKGYRCFDPSSRKIITTMNCNFLESEFFYTTHLGRQGENSDITSSSDLDNLSWLVSKPNDSNEDPLETPAVATAEHTSPPESPKSTPITFSTPISEVTPETPISEDITPTNTAEVEEEDNTIDGDSGRYILPPRINRGVPPK